MNFLPSHGLDIIVLGPDVAFGRSKVFARSILAFFKAFLTFTVEITLCVEANLKYDIVQ